MSAWSPTGPPPPPSAVCAGAPERNGDVRHRLVDEGSAIAWTEASRLERAADTELRAAGPAALVAWDPIHEATVQIARVNPPFLLS